MAAEGTSFLPRILSVFYAVFHDKGGTNIVYQVPEGLIATSNASLNATLTYAAGKNPAGGGDNSEATSQTSSSGEKDASRASSSSRYSHLANSRETLGSSFIRSSSTTLCLFKFEDISRYVIPPSALCGRLITCTTRRHQIIGFPVELYNRSRYERNYFRYNVCFVFERTADLSCYEPIVRKIGRVLTACEEESSFLSSPETSTNIYSVLEQLYEDLNSYSETSIPIDKFNSIELKIFPFYPNPPEVHDWEVPVALINLKKRIEDNWDLTMAQVCPFIDGINHVSRIAELADCDLNLTREAIRHLLFYQVIMMIDIFQFSNMYTLCRSISWLADEAHVRGECGPYVTQEDREISDWPDLLHLYSRLKPGITVFEWMQEYDTHRHGIDPRRFVSFGVIKGFLRRVHRWPVYLPSKEPEKDAHEHERRASSASLSFGRKRGKSLTLPNTPQLPGTASPGRMTPPIVADANVSAFFARNNAAAGVGGSTIANGLTRSGSQGEEQLRRKSGHQARRASAAEKYLEQFKRDIGDLQTLMPHSPVMGANEAVTNAARTSPRASRYVRGDGMRSRRQSLIQQPNFTIPSSFTDHTLAGPGASDGLAAPAPIRPRLSRSPTSQATILLPQAQPSTSISTGSGIFAELRDLLDGTRHTDELGVRLELGWPALEKHLVAIGEGKGNGDFGKVEIIYR